MRDLINKFPNQQSLIHDVTSSAFILESRFCGDCKNFKIDKGANVIGTCGKKLMTVTKSMKVTYREEDGSCFE